jgi:hypothetical protein
MSDGVLPRHRIEHFEKISVYVMTRVFKLDDYVRSSWSDQGGIQLFLVVPAEMVNK